LKGRVSKPSGCLLKFFNSFQSSLISLILLFCLLFKNLLEVFV